MPRRTDEQLAALRAWNAEPDSEEQQLIRDLADDLRGARAALAVWERHREAILMGLEEAAHNRWGANADRVAPFNLAAREIRELTKGIA